MKTISKPISKTSVDLRRGVLYVPLTVGAALFMQTVDASILLTSLPMVAEGLHADPARLNLASAAYYLGLGLFIPVSGIIADRFGTRDVFCFSLMAFLLGSILCGRSNNLSEFVFFRFLLGASGALMVPVGRIAILRSAPKDQLVAAMGYFTIPSFVAPIIGPPIGAIVTQHLSWPWIFYLNVPMCLIIAVAARVLLSNAKDVTQRKVDYPDVILSTTGCGLVMFALTMHGETISSVNILLPCLVLGAGLFSISIRRARRLDSPLLDFKLFAVDTYRRSVLGGSISRAGSSAVPFLAMLALQLAFELPPVQTGWALGGACVGAIMVKFAAPALLRHFGFRTVLLWSSWLNAASTVGLSIACSFASLPGLILAFLAGMTVRTLLFTALNTVAYVDINKARMSQAATLAGSAQEISMGLGMALGGFLLEASLRSTTSAGPAMAPSFAAAFLSIGLVSLGIVPFLFGLKPDAGSAAAGHPPSPVGR